MDIVTGEIAFAAPLEISDALKIVVDGDFGAVVVPRQKLPLMFVEDVGDLADVIKDGGRVLVGVDEIFVVLVAKKGLKRRPARANAALATTRWRFLPNARKP